jgi:hypothetical protein
LLSETNNTAQTNISALNNQQSTSTQLSISSVQQIDGASGKIIDNAANATKQLLDATLSGLR